MVCIIKVDLTNIAWAMEFSGKTYDELLDAINDAERGGYVCTVECSN